MISEKQTHRQAGRRTYNFKRHNRTTRMNGSKKLLHVVCVLWQISQQNTFTRKTNKLIRKLVASVDDLFDSNEILPLKELKKGRPDTDNVNGRDDLALVIRGTSDDLNEQQQTQTRRRRRRSGANWTFDRVKESVPNEPMLGVVKSGREGERKSARVASVCFCLWQSATATNARRCCQTLLTKRKSSECVLR